MASKLNSMGLGGAVINGWDGHRSFVNKGLNLDELVGQSFNPMLPVTRKAKYLIFHLSTGTLLCHNKFTGYWDTKNHPWSFDYIEFKRSPDKQQKDIRVRIALADDILQFHDARCLGLLEWYPGVTNLFSIQKLAHMGPDVILTSTTDPQFKQEWKLERFTELLAKSRQSIKLFLIDQKNQAGIGNIYGTEALYHSRINPLRPSNTLSNYEIGTLWHFIKDLLEKSINFELDYTKFIAVFRKANCPQGHPVKRIVQANRGTYFCSVCQG